MTPAQLQEICVEAEDLRHEVQAAYRRGEMTDGDASDLLRMVRDIRLFVKPFQGTKDETSTDPHRLRPSRAGR